jgi:hypothetical protein
MAAAAEKCEQQTSLLVLETTGIFTICAVQHACLRLLDRFASS